MNYEKRFTNKVRQAGDRNVKGKIKRCRKYAAIYTSKEKRELRERSKA